MALFDWWCSTKTDFSEGNLELFFNRDNLESQDLLLIRKLFATECVSAFSLHKDFMLSVGQIVRLIDKFVSDGLVEVEKTVDNDASVRLTEFGRSWLLENENWLIQGNLDRFWRKTPDGFRQSPLEYDQQYELEPSDIVDFFGD